MEHFSNRLSRGYDQQDPDDGAGQEDISQVSSIGFVGSVMMTSLQVQCGGGDCQPVQGIRPREHGISGAHRAARGILHVHEGIRYGQAEVVFNGVLNFHFVITSSQTQVDLQAV